MAECYSEAGHDGFDICGESDIDDILEREQYYRDLQQLMESQAQTTSQARGAPTTGQESGPITTCGSAKGRTRGRTLSPPRHAEANSSTRPTSQPVEERLNKQSPETGTRYHIHDLDKNKVDKQRSDREQPPRVSGGAGTVSPTMPMDADLSPFGPAMLPATQAASPPQPRAPQAARDQLKAKAWQRPLPPTPRSPPDLEVARVKKWHEVPDIVDTLPAAQPCTHDVRIISAASTVTVVTLSHNYAVDMLKRGIAQRHGLHP